MQEKNIKREYTLASVRTSNMEIRSNQELCELHKDLDTVANIKKKRLEWIGCVVRMD